jgi:hypothetical protein
MKKWTAVVETAVTKRIRKRVAKICVWLLMVILSWCDTLGTVVWRYGMHDGARESD